MGHHYHYTSDGYESEIESSGVSWSQQISLLCDILDSILKDFSRYDNRLRYLNVYKILEGVNHVPKQLNLKNDECVKEMLNSMYFKINSFVNKLSKSIENDKELMDIKNKDVNLNDLCTFLDMFCNNHSVNLPIMYYKICCEIDRWYVNQIENKRLRAPPIF